MRIHWLTIAYDKRCGDTILSDGDLRRGGWRRAFDDEMDD